jgi:hypothetical protein
MRQLKGERKMQTNIRTRWHKLVQLVDENEVYLTSPPGGEAKHWLEYGPVKHEGTIKKFVKDLCELPKFVVDTDLLELVMKEGYAQSLMDMRKADVLRLPFPAVIVEFDYNNVRQLVLLRDQYCKDVKFPWEPPEYGTPEFYAIKKDVREGWVHDGMKDTIPPVYGVVFRLEHDTDGDYVVMSPSVCELDLTERDGKPWLGMTSYKIGSLSDNPELEDLVSQTYKKDASAIYRAVAATMLVMNTEGVEHEVIDCSKINKKRTLSNKPPVPRHTVLKIGKIYRTAKSGEERPEDYIPRRSPRPHWRLGHLRHVHFGKNREQVKQVYIKPRIVALKPAYGVVDPPTNKEYVVRK